MQRVSFYHLIRDKLHWAKQRLFSVMKSIFYLLLFFTMVVSGIAFYQIGPQRTLERTQFVWKKCRNIKLQDVNEAITDTIPSLKATFSKWVYKLSLFDQPASIATTSKTKEQNHAVNSMSSEKLQQLEARVLTMQKTISTLERQVNKRQAIREAFNGYPFETAHSYDIQPTLKKPALYSLYAIIPGRAWIHCANGKIITVSVHSVLPNARKVQQIDVANGVVYLDNGHLIEFKLDDV